MAKVSSGTVKTSSYDGRYYQLDWTSTQSIPNNQTTISWTLKAVGGNSGWYAERTLNVVIGGVTAYSKTDRVERRTGTITSGTRVVNHNSVGDATITIAIKAAVYVSTVNCTGSSTFELANIPRKSTLTVADGTLGTTQTLTVTRQSTSFTHTITYTCGTASGTICTKSSSTSISFTPPTTLASQNTTGTSVNIKYTITTYNGDTSIGSNEYTKTYEMPEYVKPVLSVTTAATGNTKLGTLQSLTKLSVTITASSYFGANIVSCVTTIDGKTYTGTSFTTELLTTSGDLTLTTTAIDTRGREGSTTKTITVQPYTLPKVEGVTVIRCNSDGTANGQGAYMKISYNYKYSTISGNTLYVQALCKKKSATGYEPYGTKTYTTASGTDSMIIAADTDSAYDITLNIYDTAIGIANCMNYLTSVGTVNKFLSFFKNVGLGVGKIFDTSKPNSVQVAWNTYFDKDVYIKDTPVRAKRCVCGQNGNSDTNPWHKFASVTANEMNEDMRISFKITFAYGSVTRFATLNACIRTENANGGNAFQNLVFESDTGLDASNFVLAYSGTGVGAVYELWVKLTAYRFCQFEVLSESSRLDFVDRWTLYDSVSTSGEETPTSGYTQITATKPYLLNTYPVGAYYISHNTTSPASLFGGTWQRIESRFLWACPTSGTIGATGGEQTHTLTISEMPWHTHNQKVVSSYDGEGLSANVDTDSYSTNAREVAQGVTTGAAGGGAAHNNMPPYVAVAIWRRTA